jgi:hypothetical protein
MEKINSQQKLQPRFQGLSRFINSIKLIEKISKLQVVRQLATDTKFYDIIKSGKRLGAPLTQAFATLRDHSWLNFWG